jgi:hypothetical protein
MTTLKKSRLMTFVLSIALTSALFASDEPVIVAQPKSIAQCKGGTELLQVAVADGVLATYQWQQSSDKTTWTNIDKAIDAKHQPDATIVGTTWYRAVVTTEGNNAKSVVSDMAEVKVADALSVTISTHAGNIICDNVKLELKATTRGGAGLCTLQWQQQLDGKDWEDIKGENKETLVLEKLTANSRFKARFVCSGSGCCD